jgi:hypothetical protein
MSEKIKYGGEDELIDEIKHLTDQLNEARAACAKKDEALREVRDGSNGNSGRCETCDSVAQVVKAALAEDCGKPLLAELERLRKDDDCCKLMLAKCAFFLDANRWIARSEREPTAADGSVLGWYPKLACCKLREAKHAKNWKRYGKYQVTHWRKITPPQEERKPNCIVRNKSGQGTHPEYRHPLSIDDDHKA